MTEFDKFYVVEVTSKTSPLYYLVERKGEDIFSMSEHMHEAGMLDYETANEWASIAKEHAGENTTIKVTPRLVDVN